MQPLVLFGALSLVELVLGRVNSAVQLRVTPRQRQYVARALFSYLHRHSHGFLNESFAGALANRINRTFHGVNQVLWALITEFSVLALLIGAGITSIRTSKPGPEHVYVHLIGDRGLKVSQIRARPTALAAAEDQHRLTTSWCALILSHL